MSKFDQHLTLIPSEHREGAVRALEAAVDGNAVIVPGEKVSYIARKGESGGYDTWEVIVSLYSVRFARPKEASK